MNLTHEPEKTHLASRAHSAGIPAAESRPTTPWAVVLVTLYMYDPPSAARVPIDETVSPAVAPNLDSRRLFVPSFTASAVLADASRMYVPAFMLMDLSTATTAFSLAVSMATGRGAVSEQSVATDCSSLDI